MTHALRSMLVAAAWICAIQPALAVPPGQISRTATMVCVYRGIAAEHPDPKLRNPDELAARLCRRPLNLGDDYAGARKYIDNSGETYSSYFYVNARTHYIDAALRRAVEAGATQVVVMGAGFDSRAYRFRSTYPGVRFFEVDLPATSAAKQARVAEVLGAVPGYVRYAPIDFDKQRLEDVLPPLGYDRNQKTFFIMEGVVMYVVEPGVGATLGFIRNHSAPGSRLVYDYILRPVAEGKYGKYYAAGTVAMAVASAGEPYVTGWMPREAAAFVKKHGLQVVEDVGSKELTARHLLGSDGKPDGKLHDWLRIIEAKVP